MAGQCFLSEELLPVYLNPPFHLFFFFLPLTFVAEKQSLTKLVFKQKVIAIKSLQRGLGVGDHDFCLFVCLN